MKKIMTLVAFVSLAASGCNSGSVAVSSGSTPGSAPAAAQGPASAQAGTSGNTNKSNKQVYFERVIVDEGVPQFLVAISYASQNTQDQNSFGIPLTVPQDFNPNATFYPNAPLAANVTYLRSIGIGADSVVKTVLSSTATDVLYTFPKTVIDFAINPKVKTGGLNAVAWVDSAGEVYLVSDGDTSNAIDLAGQKATSIIWNSSGDHLLVRTANSAMLFSENGNSVQLQKTITDVTATQFSEDGTQLACVKTDKSLNVTTLTNSANSDVRVATLNSSEVYDLSWNSLGLVYWTRLLSGVQEIRVLQANSTSEVTIAQLSIPSTIGNGVICPNYDGKSLFFSDFNDGLYVIEKLNLDKKLEGRNSQPEIFSRPLSSREGLICPKS